MKKIFLLTTLILSANIIAQTFTDNGINYNVTDPINFKVEVGDNTSFSGSANIPTTVVYNSQTYEVTSILANAFYYSNSLTSITIGNLVNSIGNYAFEGCNNLTSVTIGNSVTSIGNYAFSYCSGLTSMIIPNSVTSIGNFAFHATSLMTVTIGDSITSIGSFAFAYCNYLTTVNCYITTPLPIDLTVFDGVNQANCALNVNNATAVVAYEATAVWTDFNPINGVLANNSFVKDGFYLYPNPSNGILNISLENNLQLEKVTIYNQLNQVVKTMTTTYAISTSELARGSYFVEVVTNKGKRTKQLLVQ